LQIDLFALFDPTLIYRYLNYRLRARHSAGKGIHSPYACHFIRDVFFGDPVPGMEIIENIRNTMLSDRTMLQVRDHGAGSQRGMDRVRSVRDLARYTSISRKYGHALARMVRSYRPRTVIELGTGTGLSTLYMSLADPRIKVITCEGSDSIADIARLNLRIAGASNVKIITGRFEAQLPDLLNQTDDELLLFMDGDHREENMLSVFSSVMDDHKIKSGILVFDDINWSAGMLHGWDRIRIHPGISLSLETFRMGIILFGKQVEKEHLVINF
jgi:predicted O-methyltransferase YrrM